MVFLLKEIETKVCTLLEVVMPFLSSLFEEEKIVTCQCLWFIKV